MVPMDDLTDFIVNNEAFEKLFLLSDQTVTLEESTALSQAISTSAHLREVQFWDCKFRNNDDGSFERLLEGCSRKDSVHIRCKHI